MDIQIHGKQVEVTPRLRAYAEKKLSKLDKHLPHTPSPVITQVELSQERTKAATNRSVVQVTIECNGTLLRGEQRAADFFAAIDAIVDIMQRQVSRYKARVYRRDKRTPSREDLFSGEATAEETAAEVAVAEETFPEGRLVRTKRFEVKPMTPEEAIDQMELLGHDFFLFLNASTASYNVIYRRRDGDYGLLVPEAS